MKSKEVKRKEAIARNGKYTPVYMAQAKAKGIPEGSKKMSLFVAHKIGIPKKEVK